MDGKRYTREQIAKDPTMNQPEVKRISEEEIIKHINFLDTQPTMPIRSQSLAIMQQQAADLKEAKDNYYKLLTDLEMEQHTVDQMSMEIETLIAKVNRMYEANFTLERERDECLPWLQALTRHISAPNETLDALITKLGAGKI